MNLKGSKIILEHKDTNKTKIIRYYDWMSNAKLYWIFYGLNITLFLLIFFGYGAIILLILSNVSGVFALNFIWLTLLFFLSLTFIIIGPGIIGSISGYRYRVKMQVLIFLVEGYKIVDHEKSKLIITQYLSIPVYDDLLFKES